MIMLVVYLVLYLAAVLELVMADSPVLFGVFALTFYLSRIFSGLAAVNFKGARNNGMLYTFTSVADRRRVNGMLGMQLCLCIIGMTALNFFMVIAILVVLVLFLCYYRHMAYQEFGGVTGDLAGFLLCGCELCAVLVLAVGWKI